MPFMLHSDNALAGTEFTWRRAIVALMAVHFALLLWIGITRHWGFMTSLNDLGMYDQAVWGVLHGKPFLNTASPFNTQINWLGFHFNLILVALVPFYWVVETPEWFILAQATALTLAALPLYHLACRVSRSERAGFLWAAVYLFNPFLLNAAAWDFHAVSLAVPFVALALLAVDTRNVRLFVVSCLILLTIQEQMGIMVAGFGLLWGLRHRSWSLAAILVGIGLGHALLVLGVIMPALSPNHAHPMLSAGLGQVSRYEWLAVSLRDMTAHPLACSFKLGKQVLVDMRGGFYLISLLLPLLFLPLGGMVFLLPGMADVAANVLSATPMPRSPFAYHSAVLVPVLTVAAVHGARRLTLWQKRLGQAEVAGLTLSACLSLSYIFWPLGFWAPTGYVLHPDPALSIVDEAVSPSASLSVQANVGAHFSRRNSIQIFPANVGQVDRIVLHLASPTRKMGNGRLEEIGVLAHHLQMGQLDYLDTVRNLLADPRYGVAVWNDPWLVFARGATATPPVLQSAILARLDQLRQEWRPTKSAPKDREAVRASSSSASPIEGFYLVASSR